MIIVTEAASEYLSQTLPALSRRMYRIALNDYTIEGIDLRVYPDNPGDQDEVVKAAPCDFIMLKSEVGLVTEGDLLIDVNGSGEDRELRLEILRRKSETGEVLSYDPDALDRLKKAIEETTEITDAAKTELYFQVVELQGLGKRFKALFNRVIPGRREKVFPQVMRRALDFADAGLLKVLDIGSGSASTLLYGHDQQLIELTCVDLLADWYARLHEIFNIDHGAKLIRGEAEKLGDIFLAEAFGIVHCSGALDHTNSPYESMDQIHRVTKKGGLMVIASDIMEGTNRNWVGLHQHDLILKDDGELVCAKRDGQTKSLVAHLGVRCLFHHRAGNAPGDSFEVIYKKL